MSRLKIQHVLIPGSFPEVEPKGDDILLGAESPNDATNRWFSRIGTWSAQYGEWSDKVIVGLRNEFKGKRFLVREQGKWMVADPETIENWMKHAFLYPAKKGAKTKPRIITKRKPSDNADEEEPSFRKGQYIYAFDRLYKGRIVEKNKESLLPGENGTSYRVHWCNFAIADDSNVLEQQMVPVTAENDELYRFLEADFEEDVDRSSSSNKRKARITLDDTASVSSNINESQLPKRVVRLRMSTKEHESLPSVLAKGLIRCRDEIARNESLKTPEAVLQVPVWKWTEKVLQQLPNMDKLIAKRDEVQAQNTDEDDFMQQATRDFRASIYQAKLDRLKKVERHMVALIQSLTE